jgi:methylenetetrahydrofolate reductase (NADPH)
MVLLGMKIADILARKKVTFSFEVFPPKTAASLPRILETVREVSRIGADFISVTYGAGGGNRSGTLEIARTIAESGCTALSHLTCVGDTAAEVTGHIRTLREGGVENVLALRGDLCDSTGHPAAQGTAPGFAHASDLVPHLKDAGFCVGGACYPEGHPESASLIKDIDSLKHKVDAGCDFLTTQMFFDNALLYSFLYRVHAQGIHVPVIAGIMPITNASQIERMLTLSGAYMPRKLKMLIDRFGGNPPALYQAGIAYAIDQIIDLVANGIRGIHIYTMNKSAVAKAIADGVGDVIGAVQTE